jgi:hypothetical protein
LSLDMCMCFHSFFLKHAHLEEELSPYRPSKPLHLFWQWMPMGEKFWGFKGNWASCFGFVLKHLPYMLCLVEYIVETPPTTLVGNTCNEIQVHSHMHRLWGSLFYIWWLY